MVPKGCFIPHEDPTALISHSHPIRSLPKPLFNPAWCLEYELPNIMESHRVHVPIHVPNHQPESQPEPVLKPSKNYLSRAKHLRCLRKPFPIHLDPPYWSPPEKTKRAPDLPSRCANVSTSSSTLGLRYDEVCG
jgi:hypothetical protein